MENLQERIDNYNNLGLELTKEVLEKIKELVIKNDGEIILDSDDEDQYFTIPCEGDLNSIVYSIVFTNGDVYVNSEHERVMLKHLPGQDIVDLYTTLNKYTLSDINTETECIDHLLQMSCDYFTETMRKIGALGEDDYVTEYSSEAIANAVVDSNQAGYDVILDLPLLHDEFIYVRYEGESPNKVCKINGIMDSREDWCEWFNLKEVAKNHAEEIMNTGYSNE